MAGFNRRTKLLFCCKVCGQTLDNYQIQTNSRKKQKQINSRSILDHQWTELFCAFKNLPDRTERAIQIATQKSPHDSNLSSLRSGAQNLAFHLLGLVVQFSEISLFYIFIHEGTIEISPEMGPSMVFMLVSPLEAIISTCMLVKVGFISTPKLPEMSAS